MSKHTPAPWFSIDDTIFAEGYNGHNRFTATIHRSGNWVSEDIPTSKDEIDANLRLMEASPYLLAQHDANLGDLILLRKAIECGDPKVELMLRVDDLKRRTDAVIFKATGVE